MADLEDIYEHEHVSTPARLDRQIRAMSEVHHARLQYDPPLPPILKGAFRIKKGVTTHAAGDEDSIKRLFPKTSGMPTVDLVSNFGGSVELGHKLQLGVVFSGGPAPGGHNVIGGILDFLTTRNTDSKLFGFLGGPGGLVDGRYILITPEVMAPFRNQGGFHLLGSGRTKIETKEQFEKVSKVATELKLDGIVVIGGDDSNTNAALMAEHFAQNNIPTKVVGVPKTIDGDLRNQFVELSFGFDTATKVYSELIANLAMDAASAKKTYHLVRLMGRDASHITLECALQTHPNLVFIGEEVAALKKTMFDVTKEICDLIVARAAAGRQYGLILIPEGIVDFMPDMRALIRELNEILAKGVTSQDEVSAKLTPDSCALFAFLPRAIKEQLLAERDPHGNVQVSKIETERLFDELVSVELDKRKAAGQYKGTYSSVTHFFGYEGRCSLPSNFDCNYCYALGHTAAALIESGQTAMVVTIRNLQHLPKQWVCGGVPLTMMMNIERRAGKDKPVIRKTLVDLNGTPFKKLAEQRGSWGLKDEYRNPGSLQHFGPLADILNFTLQLEQTQ